MNLSCEGTHLGSWLVIVYVYIYIYTNIHMFIYIYINVDILKLYSIICVLHIFIHTYDIHII